MWLTLILRQWQVVVILLLSCALGASHIHGRFLKSELDAKIAEISAMRIVAQSYADQSKTIAKEINDAIPARVEQAKKTAYANYLKKYGNNAACGISVRLPNVSAGLGEADSPGELDEASADHVPDPARELAEQCAETTVMVTEWQQWARDNDLEVK